MTTTTNHQPQVGDTVVVPATRHTAELTIIVSRVGRRYFEGTTPDGQPVGPTGIGLLAGETI